MVAKTTYKCPECGAELDFNTIIGAMNNEQIELFKKHTLNEALAKQKEEDRKKFETELESVKRQAADSATADMKVTLDALTAQIESLQKSNDSQREMIQKFMEEKNDLEQKAKDAEIAARADFDSRIKEIEEDAKKRAEAESADAIAQLNKKLRDADSVTNDLKRKLEQGSQQLQGEVQELDLEGCLKTEFHLDIIEPVEKGKNGADVIQTVVNKAGMPVGKIVWESKNTKNWNNSFIPKLVEDVDRANGTVGILVTRAFGKNMAEFTSVDGVWLVRPENALSMARVIRANILSVSEARAVGEKQCTIQEAVYEYVTSDSFRNRLQTIGMQYRALDKSIEKAKSTMIKEFDKQRKMIDTIVTSTAGILGEVESFYLAPVEDDQEDD